MQSFASDFEIFLNTPDPEMARRYIDRFPFSGLTCNPQMMSEMYRKDFVPYLKDLRDAAGDKKLFVQTPSNDYDVCFGSRHFQAIHQSVRSGWESVYGQKTIRGMLQENGN